MMLIKICFFFTKKKSRNSRTIFLKRFIIEGATFYIKKKLNRYNPLLLTMTTNKIVCNVKSVECVRNDFHDTDTVKIYSFCLAKWIIFLHSLKV